MAHTYTNDVSDSENSGPLNDQRDQTKSLPKKPLQSDSRNLPLHSHKTQILQEFF